MEMGEVMGWGAGGWGWRDSKTDMAERMGGGYRKSETDRSLTPPSVTPPTGASALRSVKWRWGRGEG